MAGNHEIIRVGSNLQMTKKVHTFGKTALKKCVSQKKIEMQT